MRSGLRKKGGMIAPLRGQGGSTVLRMRLRASRERGGASFGRLTYYDCLCMGWCALRPVGKRFSPAARSVTPPTCCNGTDVLEMAGTPLLFSVFRCRRSPERWEALVKGGSLSGSLDKQEGRWRWWGGSHLAQLQRPENRKDSCLGWGVVVSARWAGSVCSEGVRRAAVG
jgi:hypothetical protein